MISSQLRNVWNFIYFHRRRILIAMAFSGTYAYIAKRAVHSNNDLYRMGIAGSLANIIVEGSFHFVDTVNVRAKISDKHESSIHMVRKIYNKEGLSGFSKGFSACFYGSVFCGFIYFSLYKLFKGFFKEYLGESYNIAWSFFIASFAAEFFTLIVYYPYDLVKCRL